MSFCTLNFYGEAFTTMVDLVSSANSKTKFNSPMFAQDREGQSTNNGIKYKLQLLYANGKIDRSILQHLAWLLNFP